MSDLPVIFKDGRLFLSSFLSENLFGRTDFGQFTSEKGILSETDCTGHIEFADWTFTETVIDNGTVCFCGKSDKMTCLYDEFSIENAFCVLKVIDCLIEKAKMSQTEIPFLPGAAGIFIQNDKTAGKTKVLFLPGNLFEKCVSSSKEYGIIQGIFNHKGLSGIESLLFLRGVIAYKAVTGNFPFYENNLEKRQADFVDENFIPVEYEINGIKEETAGFINDSLKVKAEKHAVPGEKRFKDEKFETKRKLLLENAFQFNADMILPENLFSNQNLKIDDEVFLEKKAKFLKKQKKNLLISRFFKRNRNQIFTGVIIFAVTLSCIFSFNRENRKLATSTGLTSLETTKTLYTAVHKADVTVIQEIAKGKKIKGLKEKVSGFYVTNKQREAANEKEGTFTPAQWLFFKGNTQFWQYGITNLKIDGMEEIPDFNYPRRKDKKQPILEEDGRKLKKGDKAIHTADYYLVHYDGPGVIAVYPVEETITLEWNGKRWIVREIKGKTRANSYREKTYREDYLNALEKTGGSVRLAADILRQKYPFVPGENELASETEYLIKKYNLSAAKEF